MAKRPRQTDAQLEARLNAALQERDDALLQLARERELSNAFRLAALHANEGAPPSYPTSAGIGAPPMRYVLADQVNAALKATLAPVHGVAKGLADRAMRKKS